MISIKSKKYCLIILVVCVLFLSGCKSNGTKVGSKICFDTECFYIIKNDSTNKTITAISANVLNKSNRQYSEGPLSSKLELYFYDKDKFNYAYWDEILTANGLAKLKPSYGEKFPAYVYDSNSLIYSYLEDYKKYLNEELNANITSIRLPSLEDMSEVGCTPKADVSQKDCVNTPEWVYGESYWLGTAASTLSVYYFGSSSDGYIGTQTVTGIGASKEYVRPVIELPL